MDNTYLHITGSQAIQLLRHARLGTKLCTQTVPFTHVQELNGSALPTTLESLQGLTELLGVSRKNPLELRVPNDASRTWISAVHCTTLNADVPNQSFLELRSGTGAQALSWPSNIHVLIDGPGLAVVEGARALLKLLTSDKLDELQALLRLLEFCDELCGHYVRDPLDHRSGKPTYDEPHEDSRLCNPEQLISFLKALPRMDGVRLARRVAQHTIDESGSPMESYFNHALTLPPRLAGLSLPKPLANKQLRINDDERGLMLHDSLRPDLQWPEQRVLAEYLGDEPHAGKAARVEDKNRLLDYASTRYVAFPLMFDDVRNATALNRTAQMIARELMHKGCPQALYRVRRIQSREGFASKQNTLIATLLPPVKRYDDVG